MKSVTFIGPTSWGALSLVGHAPQHCKDFDEATDENELKKRDINKEIVKVGGCKAKGIEIKLLHHLKFSTKKMLSGQPTTMMMGHQNL